MLFRQALVPLAFLLQMSLASSLGWKEQKKYRYSIGMLLLTSGIWLGNFVLYVFNADVSARGLIGKRRG